MITLGLRLVAFVGVVLAGACVSVTVKQSEAQPVPPKRIFAYQEMREGYATVVVVRDRGPFRPTGEEMNQLLVDGELAAVIDFGEKVTLYVPPGNRIFGTRRDNDFMIDLLDETSFYVEPSGEHYFRIFTDARSGAVEYRIFPSAEVR